MDWDWDPRRSSLVTGAGTPWGETSTAPGSDPTLPTYETNPNNVPGFDYGPMRAALEQSLRERGARQQQGSRSSLLAANPYGGTQGSTAGRMYGLGRVDTESSINSGLAELARQDYAERMAAMERANNAAQRRFELDLQRQATEDANFQREQDRRAGFYRGLGGVLTAGLGGG